MQFPVVYFLPSCHTGTVAVGEPINLVSLPWLREREKKKIRKFELAN